MLTNRERAEEIINSWLRSGCVSLETLSEKIAAELDKPEVPDIGAYLKQVLMSCLGKWVDNFKITAENPEADGDGTFYDVILFCFPLEKEFIVCCHVTHAGEITANYDEDSWIPLNSRNLMAWIRYETCLDKSLTECDFAQFVGGD